MKKLWKQYSYAIILVILSFTASIIFAGQINGGDTKEYIMVTVEEGESLWAIADKYSDRHDLNSYEFISWVEKTNGINGDKILPGDELVIPVLTESESSVEITEYAGQ